MGLRALGRPAEATEPFQASLQACIELEDWKEAAIRAGNLCDLYLTLGDVKRGVTTAEESVELADRSGDAVQRMRRRSTLGDALHQAGHLEASAAVFHAAEAIQEQRQRQHPRL